MLNDYSVYSRKTDMLLAFGTARECAKALGLTLGSFWSMVSRVRTGKNRKYLVYLEDAEDDD